MRAKLLLALLAVPVACAATSRPAEAQRDSHVYGYRDGRHRDRIYISSHRYKEPAARARLEARRHRDRSRYQGYRNRDTYRYRDDDRYYRDDYRYRDEIRYRDRYEYRRRRTNVLDLVLLAAGVRLGDRYAHRHTRRCRHGDIYIGR